MKLKSFSLNGFKTFASKTDFEFADEVTVIVGPNGSGKSNIADAVRWVLGEQSYKLLRGKKTLDMIFSGSDQRARAGMASATITFDNSDGWLPIDFSEVTITRKAYRDGKNEYLINGQQVLLRDITELLGQSGLAERTYTIIGQGLVDAVLSLKAEERRSLFEEAAGIGLYRSRRIDAEKRLEKTHRNLDRVLDILSELKPRVKSLEKQALRVEKYQQVKKDLRALLREWYGYHWFRVQTELSQSRSREETQRAALTKARSKQTAYDRKLSENQIRVQSLRSKLNSWHRDLSNNHTKKEEYTREQAVNEERIRTLKKRQLEVETEKVRLEEQAAAQKQRVQQAEGDLEQALAHFREAESKAGQIRQTYQAYRDKIIELESGVEEDRQLLEQLKNERISLEVRVEERKDQIQRGRDRMSAIAEQIETASQDVQRRDRSVQEAKQQLSEASQKYNQLKKRLEEIEKHQQQGKEVLQDLQERVDQITSEIRKLRVEIDALEEAEAKLLGYSRGAQMLLKKGRSGSLPGVRGALSDLLDVPEEYETPIAAVLGDHLDAVVLDREGITDQALALLLKNATRGVLLPLAKLVPPARIDVDQNLAGVIGLAADLVRTPAEMRPVVDLLLGQVILVRDQKEINRVLRNQPPGVRAVTLQGEVFHATGEIVAAKRTKPGILGRTRRKKDWLAQEDLLTRKLQDVEAQIPKVNQKLLDLDAEHGEVERALKDAHQALRTAEELSQRETIKLDTAQQQLRWEESRRQTLKEEAQSGEQEIAELVGRGRTVEEKITQTSNRIEVQISELKKISLDEEREQLAYWDKELAIAGRDRSEMEQRLQEQERSYQEVKAERDRKKQAAAELSRELDRLQEQKITIDKMEEKIQQDILELRELIDQTEGELEQEEEAQAELQKQEAAARKTLNRAERLSAQAELQLTRSKEKLDSMQEKIREDIGLVELDYQADVSGPTPLPLEGYVQKLPQVESVPKDLGESIREMRGQLRRLGAINPDAQQEYQEVHQRYQFMTEQLSDLRKAEADIREVIAELELVMEREFRKTFDAVAGQFRDIFSRLFGGGKGKLVLTDPEDLNLSGVDIEVKLPGRRLQGLSLLSGGERSLIATALIFALLKISPTPFCVLDEVDAMLDESNVARYRKLLRELSGETQFIVITHNRNTVQVADVIYGVIMSDDSSSQVLSLKLDQVDEVIET